jgi:hypothetical protein
MQHGATIKSFRIFGSRMREEIKAGRRTLRSEELHNLSFMT